MGERRNVYRLLVGKPERKRPLGRPRRRWIDNIKMDLLEIGVESLAQRRKVARIRALYKAYNGERAWKEICRRSLCL
jgi:hypothetical protein